MVITPICSLFLDVERVGVSTPGQCIKGVSLFNKLFSISLLLFDINLSSFACCISTWNPCIYTCNFQIFIFSATVKMNWNSFVSQGFLLPYENNDKFAVATT